MHNNISERKTHCIDELKIYLVGRQISEENKRRLCLWVSQGNSVYDNPWYYSDERGNPVDYLTAGEIVDDLCMQQSKELSI